MRKGDARPGFPGTLYVDTTVNLASLTGLTEGATAYDTILGHPA